MEDDNFDEATFKEIAILPDYRALQIIKENRLELEKILASGNAIFKDVCKRSNQKEDFQSFKKQLHEVEEYLKKNPTNITMVSENAHAIAKELKNLFQLSREEIVMLLNQLPISDSMLETMFPGKFSKDQIPIVIQFLDQFIASNDVQEEQPAEEEPEANVQPTEES